MNLEVLNTILIVALINLVGSLVLKRSGSFYCGLIGFSGRTIFNLEKLKLLMVWNNYERGEDATGLFTPKSGVIKDIIPAYKYLETKDVRERFITDDLFIGHVRAKTIGANIQKNAHPFEKENIVLAHNGTLDDTYKLALSYQLPVADYSVDSEVLAYGIMRNSNSMKKDDVNPFKILSEYKGAAAVLFYDRSTELLYAYHDSLRPLFRGWDEEGNMYISSIKESLEAINVFSVDTFPERVLHTIRNGEIIATEEYKAPVIPIKELPPVGKINRAIEYEYRKHLADNISGLDTAVVKNHHLVGFWLKACNRVVPKPGTVYNELETVKGNYYLVKGTFTDNLHSLLVEDDNGQEKRSYTGFFETKDFIPVTGSYVVPIGDVTLKKGKKKLFSIGEVIQVKAFDYKKESVIHIYSEITKQTHTLATTYVRKATPAEIAKHLGQEFEETLDESPFVSSDNHKNEESEMTDVAKVVTMTNIPSTTELDEAEQEIVDEDTPTDKVDEYIDYAVYKSVLTKIKEEVELIQEMDEAKLSTYNTISLLLGYIENASDSTFLNTMHARI